MGWRSSYDEKVSERRQHVLMLEPARHDERGALPSGLVDDDEDAELMAIMGASLDEVIHPDGPKIFWPKPAAGCVAQLQLTPFRLTLRHLARRASRRCIDHMGLIF